MKIRWRDVLALLWKTHLETHAALDKRLLVGVVLAGYFLGFVFWVAMVETHVFSVKTLVVSGIGGLFYSIVATLQFYFLVLALTMLGTLLSDARAWVITQLKKGKT